MKYRVAVLGATGLVGQRLLQILEERGFPTAEVVPLASARSVGKAVRFQGTDIEVRLAEPAAFEGVDLVLSSAGGSVSRELLPAAVERGALAVDNTSAFRMHPEVPLVVPEVNPHRIADCRKHGIVANPNCSTIQLVVALKPLHDRFGVRRVVVSTYQSISGAGQKAVDRLFAGLGDPGRIAEMDGTRPKGPLALDAPPQIGTFTEGGETTEEEKMRLETPKIMEAAIPLHATCVRIPVPFSHSEAVWIETEEHASPEEARRVLRGAPGVELLDDPEQERFPTCTHATGSDSVWVGRLRRDPTVPNGLALWIVADNIRKGAALNAVQIAELLVETGELNR